MRCWRRLFHGRPAARTRLQEYRQAQRLGPIKRKQNRWESTGLSGQERADGRAAPRPSRRRLRRLLRMRCCWWRRGSIAARPLRGMGIYARPRGPARSNAQQNRWESAGLPGQTGTCWQRCRTSPFETPPAAAPQDEVLLVEAGFMAARPLRGMGIEAGLRRPPDQTHSRTDGRASAVRSGMR